MIGALAAAGGGGRGGYAYSPSADAGPVAYLVLGILVGIVVGMLIILVIQAIQAKMNPGGDPPGGSRPGFRPGPLPKGGDWTDGVEKWLHTIPNPTQWLKENKAKKEEAHDVS